MVRTISVPVIAALAATIGACAFDSTNDDSADNVSVPARGEAVAAATSGCAHVIFCDKPGATGTECQQDGCSLSAARAECLDDLAFLGCSLHCPAIIHTSGGGTSNIQIACGGHCCSASAQYCGPRGACCDGIHFNSQCPPL